MYVLNIIKKEKETFNLLHPISINLEIRKHFKNTKCALNTIKRQMPFTDIKK